MKLKDIEESKKDVLTPKDISECLCCDPHLIRVQAHENPLALGFPVIVAGSRVKIPREGFLRHMKGLTI